MTQQLVGLEADSWVDGREPAETAAAEGSTFRPVFVVGCERSGTTMMAVLLDRHSGLAMTPETFFFQQVVPRGWTERDREGDHETLLRRLFDWFMTRDLALDEGALRRRFAAYAPTYANLFRAVMEEYARLQGKPRAGEKTPFHLWQVPMLLEWFPEAKVIGMVRDGRDVVLSILKMPWTTHGLVRLHALKWIRTVKTELRLQERYPDRFQLVKYEDVLRAPAQVLREIGEFIGETFEEGQLTGGGETGVVITRALGYKADAMGALDPSRIGAWAQKVTRRQRGIMNSTMGRMLARLGYPETGMAGFSAAERVGHWVADCACRVGLHRAWYNTFLRPAARRRRRAEEERLKAEWIRSRGCSG